MTIIPAIDIIDGKCVRLSQGDYAQKKVYADNPLDMALQFEDAGLLRLHVVDLDGAKAGKVINWHVLETLASKTKMQIDFGGGVKTEPDVQRILNAGANWVTIGSLAVKQPNLLSEWLQKYGADKFFIGADVLDREIKISGWLEDTALHINDFLKDMVSRGVSHIFCTDISKDGAMQGPSVALYQDIMNRFPAIQLVASGGVTVYEDLLELKSIGCAGAIVGKAIYEGNISMEQLKLFNSKC